MKQRKFLRTLLLFLTASLIASCATKVGFVNDYCLIAKPLSASVQDTAETKRQILEHNSQWQRLCE